MSMIFSAVKDQSLSLKVEQWLAAQEAQKIEGDVDQLPSGYVQLPTGFTKFKDGLIPMSKKRLCKSEAESIADIQKQNERTLEARKIMYAEQVKARAEARKKAKAEQFAEQKRLMSHFRDHAQYGDLKRLADECGVKPDVLAKLSQSVMKLNNWQKIKPIIENFKYSEPAVVSKTPSKPRPEGFAERVKNNREKMNKAIAENQKDFIGTCAKHGEITHRFDLRKSNQKYRFWCVDCRRDQYLKSYRKSVMKNDK